MQKMSFGLMLTCVLGLSVVAGCPAPDKAKEEAPADDTKTPAKLDPQKQEVSTKITRGSGPIATVNGQPLDRAEFDKQMDRTEERFKKANRDISSALEKRLKENMVRKLVEQELIRQHADQKEVKVDDALLATRFDEYKKRFGTDEQFTAFLERTGQKEVDIKADITKNLLREELFNKLSGDKDPTPADAKKYYNDNKEKYKQREQVRASHVLLKADKNATPADKAAKLKTAKEVLKRAKKGEDFATLAKEFSEGPTAKRGGDLGRFSRGRMVKAFEDATFGAKPGTVVGPVETQFGYHVIKVFEKNPERVRTFDEVKDSILTSLKARQKSKATREILTQLKTDAKIDVMEPGVTLKGLTGPVGGAGGALPTPNLKALKDAAQRTAPRTTPKTK